MLHSASSTTSKRRDFARELDRYGPNQQLCVSPEQAIVYCRDWSRSQYENFTVVSCLLPRRLRQDFYNVYAYCRWSDNLADEIADPATSLQLLQWWQAELEQCYTGQPRQPVLLALQQTITQYNIPLEPWTDLLSAFRQDQEVTRYADEAQLLDYCRRSANPVGRILLRLAQVDDLHAIQLSDSICTGLQLTNFCQDMAEDAQAGRIYAPRSLWQSHGVSESMLLERRVTPQLRGLLADWVERSRRQLLAGRALVDWVPSWFRTDVDLFVRGGLATLSAIEAADFDVWSSRPTLSKWCQGRLLLSSLWSRWAPSPRNHSQPELPSHA